MTWIDRLIEFLEKRLPWLLLGIKLGKRSEVALRKENVELRLKLKAEVSADEISRRNDALSDDELKSEIVGRDPK